MKRKLIFAMIFTVCLSLPAFAGKKHGNRAMIEKMEAVPCGAKEHGLTGLGSIWGSVGVTHINSDEKLCPQYLLRTDDMEYHVRPTDHKHPIILPVGKEGEFRVHKDVVEMSIPEGDRKRRRYQVVSMNPINHSPDSDIESMHKYDKPQQTLPQPGVGNQQLNNQMNNQPMANQIPANNQVAPVKPN